MIDRKTFEYGGYHFTPIRKFYKKEGDFFAISKRLASDPNLGLCTYQERQKVPLIIEGFMLFQLTKNVIFSAAKKMACCMYREKTNFLFTMNQNRKSGTLSPMPFHSPGMLLMQPEFPAADKAVTRKGRHYGREGIKTLGAVCNPKAGYRALRQL